MPSHRKLNGMRTWQGEVLWGFRICYVPSNSNYFILSSTILGEEQSFCSIRLYCYKFNPQTEECFGGNWILHQPLSGRQPIRLEQLVIYCNHTLLYRPWFWSCSIRQSLVRLSWVLAWVVSRNPRGWIQPAFPEMKKKTRENKMAMLEVMGLRWTEAKWDSACSKNGY